LDLRRAWIGFRRASSSQLSAVSFQLFGAWTLRELFCILIVAASSTLLAPAGFAQSQDQSSSGQDDGLKKFLRQYLGEPNPPFGQLGATRYSSVLVDLKEDGTKEVIVYLSGRMWCGREGCRMLILSPEGASYRVVTETTITRLPIRMLATKSNGRHDISVVVAGGGIQPGFEAVLSFDGKTYPSNPSTPPARRLDGKAEGKIVMPVTAEGTPLFQ